MFDGCLFNALGGLVGGGFLLFASCGCLVLLLLFIARGFLGWC